MNLLNGIDPNDFQIRLAHMMANIAAVSGSSSHQNIDVMMNNFNNIQRNLYKMCADPLAVAQATATVQFKSDLSPISLQNKQIGGSSGRKRKSTPEKRVITQNNGDVGRKFFDLIIFQSSLFRHLPQTNMNQ